MRLRNERKMSERQRQGELDHRDIPVGILYNMLFLLNKKIDGLVEAESRK